MITLPFRLRKGFVNMGMNRDIRCYRTPFGTKISQEVKKVAKVELKQPIVEEISANIKDAQSVVLVDYRGLTVEQDTNLRKQLREAGITYKVYKNTMMNFAFKGTDCESLTPYLEGPSAIAVSTTDATAPARILCKFAKDANNLEIKAGVVEGMAYDAAGIAEIAKIPSREELLSRLLGSMLKSLRRKQQNKRKRSNRLIELNEKKKRLKNSRKIQDENN